MLLTTLILVPLIGIFLITTSLNFYPSRHLNENSSVNLIVYNSISSRIKIIGLVTSIINLGLSIVVYMAFSFSSNYYQFVQEYHSFGNFDVYLGVDGISMSFVLLTTIIMPIALLSN